MEEINKVIADESESAENKYKRIKKIMGLIDEYYRRAVDVKERRR